MHQCRECDVHSLEHKYVVDDNGCWIWQKALTSSGYGTISHNGRPEGAHRFSYRLHRGDIPKGLFLDHLCRVRACINPDHLEPVTHAENMRRKPWSVRCSRKHNTALSRYLDEKQMTPSPFAEKASLTTQAIYKFLKTGDMPSLWACKLIYQATNGDITPNDLCMWLPPEKRFRR